MRRTYAILTGFFIHQVFCIFYPAEYEIAVNYCIYKLNQIKDNSEELTLEKLEKKLAWTEEWYAVRFQHLRKLCEDHNLLTEFCNIAANGREDSTSPPTF